MTDADVLAYVKAAAVMMDLPLDAQRAERVAGHLARTAAMAHDLDELELGVDEEPAEVYCPAPFPVHVAAVQGHGQHDHA